MISINIPRSPLASQLDRSEAIKREMAAMLEQLETAATGKTPSQPGYWRHHPAEWLAKRIIRA
jgi:hypothetical protein